MTSRRRRQAAFRKDQSAGSVGRPANAASVAPNSNLGEERSEGSSRRKARRRSDSMLVATALLVAITVVVLGLLVGKPLLGAVIGLFILLGFGVFTWKRAHDERTKRIGQSDPALLGLESETDLKSSAGPEASMSNGVAPTPDNTRRNTSGAGAFGPDDTSGQARKPRERPKAVQPAMEPGNPIDETNPTEPIQRRSHHETDVPYLTQRKDMRRYRKRQSEKRYSGYALDQIVGGDLFAVAGSAIGASHDQSGEPREDAFSIVPIGTNGLLAAVADGLGSTENSHIASRIACDAAIDYLGGLDLADAGLTVDRWREIAQDAAHSVARELGPRSFAQHVTKGRHPK